MSRSLSLAFTLSVLASVCLVACPSRIPEGPPPIHVPPGCERSQAGEYHHVGNPAFRYLAEDDGRILSLHLLHTWPDGGVGGATDAGTVMIVLARTPEGFVGATHATGFSAGSPCPVKFPTEVSACAPDTLTLRTVWKTSVNEACRPPPNGPPPKWTEQVLRRGPPPVEPPSPAEAGAGSPDAGAPVPDAGVPDAGVPDAGPRTSDAGATTPPGGPAPRKP